MLDSSLPNHPRRLSLQDRVLMVLMKLKLALTHHDLAFRFCVPVQAVSEVICTHIDVMANVMSILIPWPNRDTVNKSMPRNCKSNIPRCRIIVDCTEVFVQRSKSLLTRAKTYSNYKSHNTIKFLVGIAPSGAFTYISRCWGGRASDKQITVDEGFLDKLDFGDVFLADRGFLVHEELAVRGVTAAMPAFSRGRKQLSRKEVEKSRQLSRFRIHVERTICRLKVYKILSNTLPITLIRYSNSIIRICAELCNLRTKLF